MSENKGKECVYVCVSKVGMMNEREQETDGRDITWRSRDLFTWESFFFFLNWQV